MTFGAKYTSHKVLMATKRVVTNEVWSSFTLATDSLRAQELVAKLNHSECIERLTLGQNTNPL